MITVHYVKRAFERKGLSEEEAISFESRASRKGKRADQMPKREKMYMKMKEQLETILVVYYDRFLLIYDVNGTCITMYEAPEWFLKKRSDYFPEERKNNRKRALRYCA